MDDGAPRGPVVDFDLFAATAREAPTRRGERPATRARSAWTERNGGHWVVSGYEEVADRVPGLGALLVGAHRPEYCAITLGDSRLPLLIPEEIDPPEWYPLRRILAELLRPGRRSGSALASRTGPRTASTRSSSRAACEFVARPRVPGARGGHARVAGVPAERLADDLRRVPRRRRATRRARPSSRGRAPRSGRCWRRITEEVADRVRAPRDDAMTAIAHHEIDGEQIPTRGRRVDRVHDRRRRRRHHDVADRRRAAAPLPVPRRSAAAARRTRSPRDRHRGVPALLPAGPHARPHRGRRLRVRAVARCGRATGSC